MNEQIYKNNWESMENKFPEMAKRIGEWKNEKKDTIRVVSHTAKNGKTIFSVEKNGRELYLNGIYNPEGPIQEWLQEQKKYEKESLIILVGLSSLVELNEILEKTKYKVNILIYEPSVEVFLAAMHNINMEVLFAEYPLGIVIEGINDEELELYFNLMINYDNFSLVSMYVCGNYDEIFQDSFQKFAEKLNKYIEKILVHFNTKMRYTSVSGRNYFENIGFYYNQYSVYSLRNILPDGVPVFLIGAGPSLNKNIMELKKAKGKSCIIAVDTALKPLLNAGIFPDFVTIIDGLKPMLLFDHKEFSKIPIIAYCEVANDVMHLHHGKKFLCWSERAYEKELFFSANKKNDNRHRYNNLQVIPCGGSVAHLSFSLAQYMGAKTIVFVGQDLAMTNGRSHADGTFADKMEKLDLRSEGYFEVDGIDGGKVITRKDFNRYREWFEDQIKNNDKITYINATEGGAMIKGTQVERLSDAIKKYCKTSIDMSELLDEVPEIFNFEAKKELLKFWKDTLKHLKGVEQKIRFGFNSYKKLYMMLQRKSVTKEKLIDIIGKIRKFNNYVETNIYVEIVLESLQGVQAFFRTGIFQTENTTKEELIAIAKQGMLFTEKMFYALYEIYEIYQETIGSFSEERWVKEKNIKYRKARGKILLIFNSKKCSIRYIKAFQKELQKRKYVYLLDQGEPDWKSKAIAYQYFTDAMPFEAIIDLGGILQQEGLRDEIRKKQRYLLENDETPYYVLKDKEDIKDKKHKKRQGCVIEDLGFTITIQYEKEKKDRLMEVLFKILNL